MKKLSLLIVLSLALWALNLTVARASELSDRRVIMIVVNAISVTDLLENNLPNIQTSLGKDAAIGLMNARAARNIGYANAYLSIGSGVRSNAGRYGSLAIDRNEKVILRGRPQKFNFRGGGQVGSPAYPDMARTAAKMTYEAIPGKLGELLGRSGIKSAAFGNTDSFDSIHREINLITMNTSGSTDFGSVSKSIETPEQAMSAVKQGLRKGQFVAVDYAPTSKINSRVAFLTDQAIASQRRFQLGQVDKLFGNLQSKYLDNRTMIILATPTPPRALASKGALVTPLIISKPDFRGLLVSPDTRWPGIVTIADIAPTILTFFGLQAPPALPGRNLSSQKTSNPIQLINKISEKALANSSARSTLLSIYLTLVVFVFLFTLAVLLLWPHSPATAWLQPLLLSIMYMPVVMLITNAIQYSDTWVPLILNPSISLFAGLFTWFASKRRPAFALATISMITITVILAQLPFDSLLERNSVMGMSVLVGARFYGIGNEYSGVLLAVAVLAFVTALSLKQNPSPIRADLAATVLFLFITAVFGLPALGADVGGAIAAVATGFILVLLIQGQKLKLRYLFYVVTAIVFVVIAILLIDYLSSSKSHAARAASLVGGGGISQALIIISRKLGVNMRLLRHSSWANILVASGIVVIGLRLRFSEALDVVKKKYPWMNIGFKTIFFGSIAALVFNDSGATAAALMAVFAISSWLYLLIESARKDELSIP